MTEAAVVNLFTVVRIVLVGGIFLVIPHITRKGLLFGAYVGEELADGDEARAIVRRWHLGCLAAMALSLAVGLGISVAGWPVAGNLTATAILLLACPPLYLNLYYKARKLAPPLAAEQAEMAAAPLEFGPPKGTLLAKLTLGVCILASLATVVYATVNYGAMPDRIPTHFGPSGDADAWSDKSFVLVLLVPSLNLIISPFIALFALLTTGAKRSLRGGSGGRSAEAQVGFRAAVANLLSATALLTCTLLTFISVQMVRVALSQAESLGYGVLWISVFMVLFLLGGLVFIIAKYGQGGARLEEGSAAAPLTDGIADNTNWIWGIFYVNREDPSFLVEKRFGIGYTINFGNRKAVATMVAFLTLTLGLTAVGLISAML